MLAVEQVELEAWAAATTRETMPLSRLEAEHEEKLQRQTNKFLVIEDPSLSTQICYNPVCSLAVVKQYKPQTRHEDGSQRHAVIMCMLENGQHQLVVCPRCTHACGLSVLLTVCC